MRPGFLGYLHLRFALVRVCFQISPGAILVWFPFDPLAFRSRITRRAGGAPSAGCRWRIAASRRRGGLGPGKAAECRFISDYCRNISAPYENHTHQPERTGKRTVSRLWWGFGDEAVGGTGPDRTVAADRLNGMAAAGQLTVPAQSWPSACHRQMNSRIADFLHWCVTA